MTSLVIQRLARPFGSKLNSNPIQSNPLLPKQITCSSPHALRPGNCTAQCKKCALRGCDLRLLAYRQDPAFVAQQLVRSFEDQEVHGSQPSRGSKDHVPHTMKEPSE